MQQLGTEETQRAAAFLAGEIRKMATRPVRLMEVCGTHTVAIFRAGIRQLLPPAVELVSGPGCPVCVTANDFLDTAIAYSRLPGCMIATFGDMLRVPGSSTSLMAAKSAGADVRIVYSPLDALMLAKENRSRQVIFLAVGFETTAPAIAATVQAAEQSGVDNFFVLTAHKLVPPALRFLVESRCRVDGFLLPGHVSSIIGEGPYRFLTQEYDIPAVIAGFEPLAILRAVYTLVLQLHHGECRLENQYTAVVPPAGNPVAQQVLAQVYETVSSRWRGLGVLPASGLTLTSRYRRFDARQQIPVAVEPMRENSGCRCGEVLLGAITPRQCSLFGGPCTPESPVGACMVSVEGTCAAWYKYGTGRWNL
ncbi:hydrogenase formation hypd protein [Lucifera butyrica]|uniref:Hydrogenase formation hypd protein n=1 Tax=Lucifera butyrica TaxID=1351585 RepID=A0A498R2S4_9FIRM|nr:hydrogenase formation protein HypD [Lucifera butyrica]VBB05455.1 hydrogenase formation hypd protein [Lucifera butyrica]